jgi:hypothetical protein
MKFERTAWYQIEIKEYESDNGDYKIEEKIMPLIGSSFTLKYNGEVISVVSTMDAVLERAKEHQKELGAI